MLPLNGKTHQVGNPEVTEGLAKQKTGEAEVEKSMFQELAPAKIKCRLSDTADPREAG